MRYLEKSTMNHAVSVFSPTATRTTWRVNIMNLNDGRQARAFLETEDDALDAVSRVVCGDLNWVQFD